MFVQVNLLHADLEGRKRLCRDLRRHVGVGIIDIFQAIRRIRQELLIWFCSSIPGLRSLLFVPRFDFTWTSRRSLPYSCCRRSSFPEPSATPQGHDLAPVRFARAKTLFFNFATSSAALHHLLYYYRLQRRAGRIWHLASLTEAKCHGLVYAIQAMARGLLHPPNRAYRTPRSQLLRYCLENTVSVAAVLQIIKGTFHNILIFTSLASHDEVYHICSGDFQ